MYFRNVDVTFELDNENTFSKRYRFPKRFVLNTLLKFIIYCYINYRNKRVLRTSIGFASIDNTLFLRLVRQISRQFILETVIPLWVYNN